MDERDRQRAMAIVVAYLGPETTFTHQASLKRFGPACRQAPARTIADVFAAVAAGDAQYGVVPVENSTEGVVSYTLDLLVDSPLHVVDEVQLRVTHHLLNRSGDRADIVRIHSHPQALAQCRRWLTAHFHQVPTEDASSTAHAAAMAANDPSAAAIASDLAARIHDLKPVAKRIEDNPHNFTRFLVIGREPAGRSGRDKTSLMFAVRNEVGALYGMLKAFADAGVNLTRIQSRPLKGTAWEYVFFLDCEGHREDPAVASALAAVETRGRLFRVLGSYPVREDVD